MSTTPQRSWKWIQISLFLTSRRSLVHGLREFLPIATVPDFREGFLGVEGELSQGSMMKGAEVEEEDRDRDRRRQCYRMLQEVKMEASQQSLTPDGETT